MLIESVSPNTLIVFVRGDEVRIECGQRAEVEERTGRLLVSAGKAFDASDGKEAPTGMVRYVGHDNDGKIDMFAGGGRFRLRVPRGEMAVVPLAVAVALPVMHPTRWRREV